MSVPCPSRLTRLSALHPASLAFVAAALWGCQSSEGTRAQPDAERSVTKRDDVQNVRVVTQTRRWEGPAAVDRFVTPLWISIENDSDKPLRARLNDFALRSQTGGARFAALPLYDVEGGAGKAVEVQGDPPRLGVGARHDRFHVAPYYRGVYPTFPVYDRPFFYDPSYYERYFAYWSDIPLPNDEMLRDALPEGVIDPGGSLAGFLYFELVPPEVDRVELNYELTSAPTGERFGVVSIMFETSEL